MTNGFGREADALRVLVADGRRNVRSALRLMLEQDPGIVVSAEASNSAEVMMQVEQTRPDVIILDCDLPGLEATELLPAVRTICPGIRIVAMCARPEMKQSALSAGADAFVGKTEPPQRLLGIVRQGSGGHGTRGTQPSDRQVGGGGATMESSCVDRDQALASQRGCVCTAWGAAYVPDRETVVVNGSGRLSLEDLKGTARGAADLLLRNRASRVLLDCSEAILDVRVLDIFYLPECYKKVGVPASARIALVLPRTRQSSSIFEFYETVCRNKGYTCKLFQNHRSAEQWLA
jgi:CheY-like chemotaxis protein